MKEPPSQVVQGGIKDIRGALSELRDTESRAGEHLHHGLDLFLPRPCHSLHRCLYPLSGNVTREGHRALPVPLEPRLCCCNPRPTILCLFFFIPGIRVQSGLTQEASVSGLLGQTVTITYTGNSNNISEYPTSWY